MIYNNNNNNNTNTNIKCYMFRPDRIIRLIHVTYIKGQLYTYLYIFISLMMILFDRNMYRFHTKKKVYHFYSKTFAPDCTLYYTDIHKTRQRTSTTDDNNLF